jgi:hypothetical protein
MAGQITELVGALEAAQDDASRSTARAKLTALQKQQTELQSQLAAAKAEAAKAERLKGVKISKECLDNPLAKGCQ